MISYLNFTGENKSEADLKKELLKTLDKFVLSKNSVKNPLTLKDKEVMDALTYLVNKSWILFQKHPRTMSNKLKAHLEVSHLHTVTSVRDPLLINNRLDRIIPHNTPDSEMFEYLLLWELRYHIWYAKTYRRS